MALRAIETHPTNREAQLRAWFWEIETLRAALANKPNNWRLLLEYPLIRLGRRMDAVLVTDRAILVIEFKALGGQFTVDAKNARFSCRGLQTSHATPHAKPNFKPPQHQFLVSHTSPPRA
ncbi:NERD domain-containing protein [Acidocella sp.]|uniref:NERD domain-containing protein n=1 Tax=Acidocella sp. TaxID=50710 RepID=UPI002636C267|nr:NERD domain-containing protein [Acidocella sp.]MDD2796063.1 NERD domain-containing protein [Acidocella sp.]